jgi:hypothetical protein
MDWTATIIALALCFGIAVACGWLGARPPNPAKGPRLVPYRFLMLLAGAGVLLLLIHVRSLAGLGPEGRP